MSDELNSVLEISETKNAEYICSDCGSDVSDSDIMCLKCGVDLQAQQASEVSEDTNLFSAKGRISRSTFWATNLFMFLAALVAGFIPLLNIIMLIPILIVSISTYVKRLHDMDKSGWWVLIGYVPPILGGIVLLFWIGLAKGTDGPNQYGPRTK